MALPRPRQDRPAVQFDRIIGSRLREARVAAGLSQAQTATALCLETSVLDAIECGRAHMKAAHLLQAATLFGRPLHWFFAENATAEAVSPLTPEAVQWLAAIYAKIDSAALRSRVFDVAEEIAKAKPAKRRPGPRILN